MAQTDGNRWGQTDANRWGQVRLKTQPILTEDHTSASGKGISRALGVKSTVKIEHHSWDWQAEDQLLLVSDGISNVLEDVHLTNLLVETFGSNRWRTDGEPMGSGSIENSTYLVY